METLIIIDEQNDFCNPTGSLYVKGSTVAVLRTVDYIKEKNPEQIIVTLDTHHPLHIDLSGSWNRDFQELPCFNPDPKDSMYREECESLVKKGYPLVVWPDHCIKGTWGHALPEILSEALKEWSLKNKRNVLFIEKGLNNREEMYSAFSVLEKDIIEGDITMCGVALDYCVKYSYLDLKKAGYNIKLYLPGTARIGEVEEYWKD